MLSAMSTDDVRLASQVDMLCTQYTVPGIKRVGRGVSAYRFFVPISTHDAVHGACRDRRGADRSASSLQQVVVKRRDACMLVRWGCRQVSEGPFGRRGTVMGHSMSLI
jgi:hypothetical protein